MQKYKKIISFSLWGDNPIYTEGAIKNCEIAKDIYPDWECWFYVGQSTPKKTINTLREHHNSKVILMDEDGDWNSMFWRFFAASEKNLEFMICRDTDSRLGLREKFAVDDWIKSGKGFHIMRDHPYHATAILGGMWGVKGDVLKNMKSLIDNYQKGNFWQVDQNFLKEVVYPIIKNNCLVHDEFFEKKSFPTERRNNSFVGQAYNELDEELHPEHSELIK
jgi:hypothetical protein